MPKLKNTPVSNIATLSTAKPGEQKDGLEQVQTFLGRFGYLEENEYEANKLDDNTAAAIEKYQRFNGLPVTGEFNESTREQMTTARCGLPDMRGGIDFAVTCRWTRWSLRYAFGTGTADALGEFQAVK